MARYAARDGDTVCCIRPLAFVPGCNVHVAVQCILDRKVLVSASQNAFMLSIMPPSTDLCTDLPDLPGLCESMTDISADCCAGHGDIWWGQPCCGLKRCCNMAGNVGPMDRVAEAPARSVDAFCNSASIMTCDTAAWCSQMS